MNTTFAVRVRGVQAKLAERAAAACFRLIESIEEQLSRYLPGSDISRINGLRRGESLLVAETTHRCLLRAFEAGSRTAGLFDVTLGARTWEDAEDTAVAGRLEIDPRRPRVHCREAGRQLDLGGIGKGFALGECLLLLQDHGVAELLLSAGGSTHLAWGPSPWRIRNGPGPEEAFDLAACAWSVSGEAIQGAHVIHPDTAGPADYAFRRVGVMHPDPALADAFSTAALLMSPGELEDFASSLEPGCRVFAWPREGGAVRKLDAPSRESEVPS